MKKIFYLVVVVAFILGAFAFTTVKRYADILKDLGIENSEAKETIFANFEQGTLSFPYSKVIRKLAVGQRESAVKELGDYIKAYTATPEFAQKYKAARDAAKPQGAASAVEKIQARIQQVESDIETTELDMKSTSGDMKKLYEVSLAELKKELRALKNPSDPNHSLYVQDATKSNPFEENMAAEDIKYWEQEYPATVKELIKNRLKKFLDFTKDMNFNAKLVKRGNKMYFVDPELEDKDDTWKYCFRAGKETISASRQYAQQWLASLK